jgi:aminoglycoside phosphotransferase (APT) family kinase protein
MDSTAFEVNAKWIFRFPMRASVERQLFVERALLPVIAPQLPLAIPAFTFAGAPDVDFPMHFAGYAKLPGKPAVEIDTSRVSFDALASQLGPFLSLLHRFPVADAERLGAQTSRLEDYFEEVRLSALAGMDMLEHIAPGGLAERVERYLEKLQRLSEAPWPLALTHHDLAAEHILLDDSGASVTGVIDWGDVGIVDPTVDFVGLFTWGGTPFVRSVLASYDGPVDARVLERVRPWAAFRAIQDIRFGLDNDLTDIVRMGVRALENELVA